MLLEKDKILHIAIVVFIKNTKYKTY